MSLVEGVPNLYIKVTATAGGHTAVVEITDHHTNVTCHTLDGIPVCGKSAGECAACAERVVAERAADSADTPMSIESIIDFIEDGDIDGARAVVERQIELNGAISAEALRTLGAPRWVVRCWVLVPMTSPAVPVPVRPPDPTLA